MSLEHQNISAFPREHYTGAKREEREGMTLLDYHAAHAPANPPEWWKPNMRKRPPDMLRVNQNFSDEKRRWIEQYLNEDAEWCDKDPEWIDPSNPPDIPDSFKKEVKEYIDRWNKNYEDIQQWGKEEQYERLVQWPYYYATQMLMRRESCIGNLKHIESTKQPQQ